MRAGSGFIGRTLAGRTGAWIRRRVMHFTGPPRWDDSGATADLRGSGLRGRVRRLAGRLGMACRLPAEGAGNVALEEMRHVDCEGAAHVIKEISMRRHRRQGHEHQQRGNTTDAMKVPVRRGQCHPPGSREGRVRTRMKPLWRHKAMLIVNGDQPLSRLPRHTLLALLHGFIVSPAFGDTTLTVLTHYTAIQRAPLTACLRAYEVDHPGVHIVHQQAAIEDYLQTVLTARLSGTSPDIYNVYSMWGAQLVEAGVLDRPPLDIVRLIDAAYLPNTIDAVKVGGNAWGIPSEVTAFMLIYNKKLFHEAGVTAAPRDWDEVVSDAAKMTRRNAQGKITTTGFAFGPTVANGVYPFLALLKSRGVDLFTDRLDGTHLVTPAAIDVLAGEQRLFKDRITDNTIQVDDFPSGAVGMMIHANWYKETLRQAFGGAMDETVGVAPIPAGKAWRTLQYAFFWGVDASSRNKRAAWDLIAWLNSPGVAGKPSCTGEVLVRLGALTGNRHDLAASPDDYGDSFSKPFVDAIVSGRAGSLPNLVRASELQHDLRLAIGRAWIGALTPQTALREADRRITAVITERD